jgi:hypothetical protein
MEDVGVYLHPFLTSPLNGGKWSASHTCRFTQVYRVPGTHYTGRWASSTVRLTLRKIPFWESNSGLSKSWRKSLHWRRLNEKLYCALWDMILAFWRMLSSGTWRRTVWQKFTDISAAFIFSKATNDKISRCHTPKRRTSSFCLLFIFCCSLVLRPGDACAVAELLLTNRSQTDEIFTFNVKKKSSLTLKRQLLERVITTVLS